MKAIGYFSANQSDGDVSTTAELMELFYKNCNINGYDPDHIFSVGDYNSMVGHIKLMSQECTVLMQSPSSIATNVEEFIEKLIELYDINARIDNLITDSQNIFEMAIDEWNVSSNNARGDKIREAMASRALRGDGLGKPPFGYSISSSRRLEITSFEADTVMLIFDLYCNQDMGMRRIVRYLNDRNLPTRSGSGWSIVTVRDILRNRSYLGTYTRFGMRVPRNHEALVSLDDFNKAQENMASRRVSRSSHPREPFLISGFSFCSACGNKMVGVSRRQGWKLKDGSAKLGIYRYYQCQSRTNQGRCLYHTWKAQDLESKVIESILEETSTGDHWINQIYLDTQTKETPDKMDTRILKAFENLGSGGISLVSFREIVARVRGSESIENDTKESIGIPATLEGWFGLPPQKTKILLSRIIDSVVVYDSEVTVNFKPKL